MFYTSLAKQRFAEDDSNAENILKIAAKRIEKRKAAVYGTHQTRQASKDSVMG
jgi:hypothetical protein